MLGSLVSRFWFTARKGTVAGAVSLVGLLGQALSTDGTLTGREAGVAVGGALLAAAAVWRVTNTPEGHPEAQK